MRKAGSSVGAVIEVVAEGVPAGWGAPIYGKLDQDLAGAMMSINAVKGVEIGAGMAAAELTGEDNADEIRIGNDGRPLFLSNNAGGILGGISSGQPIVVRFAVKPTSSILSPRRTIDRLGHDTEISTKGRHDPCVGIRAVPVGEAMMAIVLADHYLRHRAQVGLEGVMRARSSRRLAAVPALQLPRRSGSARVPRRQGAGRLRRRVRAVLGLRQVHPEARSGLCLPYDHGAIAARPGALPPLRPRHRGVRDQSRSSPTAAPTPSSTASPWPERAWAGRGACFALLRLLPRPLADWLYDRVAQNRYALFGRTDSCMIPPPEWRERFLE